MMSATTTSLPSCKILTQDFPCPWINNMKMIRSSRNGQGSGQRQHIWQVRIGLGGDVIRESSRVRFLLESFVNSRFFFFQNKLVASDRLGVLVFGE